MAGDQFTDPAGDDELMLVGAVGIDGAGDQQPLGVIEGATENTAVVQALWDNLVGRGLDPTVCRLFVVDGAKALSKACPGEGRGRSARPSAVTPDPALPGSQGS